MSSAAGSSYDYFIPWLPPYVWKHSRALITITTLTTMAFIVTFIGYNQTEIKVDVLFFTIDATISWWSIFCIGYGFFLSSLIFYIRQRNLFLEIVALTKVKSDLTFTQGQYDKFKAVASQILVPYPLDQLVEKAAVLPGELNEAAYKPGQLLANRRGPTS